MDGTDGVEVPYPQYLCPVDGRALPLAEARMSVTCAEHQPLAESVAFSVREAVVSDRRSLTVTGGDLAVVMYSVYPEAQGRGVGSALLDAAVEIAEARSLHAVKAA